MASSFLHIVYQRVLLCFVQFSQGLLGVHTVFSGAQQDLYWHQETSKYHDNPPLLPYLVIVSWLTSCRLHNTRRTWRGLWIRKGIIKLRKEVPWEEGGDDHGERGYKAGITGKQKGEEPCEKRHIGINRIKVMQVLKGSDNNHVVEAEPSAWSN